MINLKSTSSKYNPKVPSKELRPRCTHENCNDAQVIVKAKQDGTPSYSQFCRKHHNEKYYAGKPPLTLTASKLGLTVTEYIERAAIIRGFNSACDYRAHRKNNPVPKQITVNETSLLQKIRSRIPA